MWQHTQDEFDLPQFMRFLICCRVKYLKNTGAKAGKGAAETDEAVGEILGSRQRMVSIEVNSVVANPMCRSMSHKKPEDAVI